MGIKSKIELTYRTLKRFDYYQLLGVSPDADKKEIFQAAQAMKQEFNPRNFPSDLDAESKRKLDEINETISKAANVLLDAEERKGYDSRGRVERPDEDVAFMPDKQKSANMDDALSGASESVIAFFKDLAEEEEPDTSPHPTSSFEETLNSIEADHDPDDEDENLIQDLTRPDSTVLGLLDDAFKEDMEGFKDADKELEEVLREDKTHPLEDVPNSDDIDKLIQVSDSLHQKLENILSHKKRPAKPSEKDDDSPVDQDTQPMRRTVDSETKKQKKLSDVSKTIGIMLSDKLKEKSKETQPPKPQHPGKSFQPRTKIKKNRKIKSSPDVCPKSVPTPSESKTTERTMDKERQSSSHQKLYESTSTMAMLLKDVLTEDEFKGIQNNLNNFKKVVIDEESREDEQAKIKPTQIKKKQPPAQPKDDKKSLEDSKTEEISKLYDASRTMALLLKNVLNEEEKSSDTDNENAPSIDGEREAALSYTEIRKKYEATDSMALLLKDVLKLAEDGEKEHNLNESKEIDPILKKKPVKLRPKTPVLHVDEAGDEKVDKINEDDTLKDQLKEQFLTEWSKVKENMRFYLLILGLILLVLLVYFFYGAYLDFVVG